MEQATRITTFWSILFGKGRNSLGVQWSQGPISWLLHWLLLSAVTFALGVVSQEWPPQEVCKNDSFGTHRCFTEQVFFWSTTVDEFGMMGDGQGDITNYVVIAKALLGELPMTGSTKQATLNWPPGVSAMIMIVKKVFGPEAYLPKMLLLFSLFLSAVLLFAQVTLVGKFNWLIFLAPFALYIFPDLQYNTLKQGYLVSEAWSLAVAILIFSQMFRCQNSKSFLSFAVLGFLAALATYYRAMFEPIYKISLLGMIVLEALILGIRAHRKNQTFWTGLFSVRGRSVGLWICSLVVFSLCLAPWKKRNENLSSISAMCTTSDSVFRLHWTPSQKMPPWLPNLNAGCNLYPDFCVQLNEAPGSFLDEYGKTLTKITLVLNPLGWIQYKSKDLPRFWPGGNYPWPKLNFDLDNWGSAEMKTHLEGGLFLILFLVLISIFLIRIIRKLFYSLCEGESIGFSASDSNSKISMPSVYFFSLFILSHVLVFLVAGFEIRYSLYLRALAVFCCLALLFSKGNEKKCR